MRQRKADATALHINNNSSSDEEEQIQAASPPLEDKEEEPTQYRYLLPWLRTLFFQPLVQLYLNISLSALLVYAYPGNVQLAVMTVIVLVGATPWASTHVLPVALGAFVGGHDIIGATGDAWVTGSESLGWAVSYLWLLLFSAVVTLVWSRFMLPYQILDGYSGRLGTTTFIGMNLIMLCLWGPLGVVGWNRYWFGFYHIVHVAEEADSFRLSDAWKWTEETELAIGYVLAVLWLSFVSGASRIWHGRYIQQIRQEDRPPPLNNLLIPCVWALFSMLIVNTTHYQHAPGLFNGFAVGAYVGMASLQKIPNLWQFLTVGLVAAGWGLALTPVCVGFAGKAGFTAMLGHATHYHVVEPILVRRRQLQQESEDSVHKEEEEEDLVATKHVPAIEVVNYTKTQRRQQQRLLHHQQPQEKQERLHHRAWVSQGDKWTYHPQEEDP